MLGFLSAAFFVLGLVLAFYFWVLPLLKDRPAFSEFRARSDSFWAAVRMKFTTIRTKLAAILVLVASVLVELHDFILPAATGIDWTPVTSLVPSWVWPFVSLGAGGLFYWLRNLTKKTQDAVVSAVAAGVPPAVAEVEAEAK